MDPKRSRRSPAATHPAGMVPGDEPAPTLSSVRTRDARDSGSSSDRDRRRRPARRADLGIEAWAPTREGCVAEAVSALLDSFLTRPLPAAESGVSFEVTGSTDAELLTAVLRHVILRIQVLNEIPSVTKVVATPTGLRLSCEVIDTGAVIPGGSIPKGVPRQHVRCERTRRGWWCSAKIEV
jgi:SHS2 domain-containing protein